MFVITKYTRNKDRRRYTIPTCCKRQNFLEYSKKIFSKEREITGHEITKNSPKIILVCT